MLLKNFKISKLIALSLVLMAPSFISKADQIILKQGDVLSGKIIQQDDHSVTLQHHILGQVKVSRQDINVIKARVDSPDSNYSSPIQDSPQTQGSATDPIPQPFLPPAQTQKAVELANEVMKTTETKGPTGDEFLDWLDHWEFELGFLMRGERAENEKYSIKADFRAKYKTDEYRITIHSAYELGWKDKTFTDSNGKRYEKIVRDIDRGHFRAEVDYFIPDSDFLLFARAQYTHNYFKDWRHRLELLAGPGYTFMDTNEWKLEARTGINYLQNLRGDDDRPQSEWLIEGRIRWKPHDLVELNLVNSFYASMNTFGESRNITRFVVKLDMGQWLIKGTYLNFRITNEYESHPESGDVHNSLYYRTGVSMKF